MIEGKYDIARSATETALRCARIQAAASVVQTLSQTSVPMTRTQVEDNLYRAAMVVLSKEFIAEIEGCKLGR